MSNLFERAIIGKLRIGGCDYDEAGSTPASMAFVKAGYSFFVPRPGSDGFTQRQLVWIERELAVLEIELLPLDLWLGG